MKIEKYYVVRIGKLKNPHCNLLQEHSRQGDGSYLVPKLFASIRNAEMAVKELTTSDVKIIRVKLKLK